MGHAYRNFMKTYMIAQRSCESTFLHILSPSWTQVGATYPEAPPKLFEAFVNTRHDFLNWEYYGVLDLFWLRFRLSESKEFFGAKLRQSNWTCFANFRSICPHLHDRKLLNRELMWSSAVSQRSQNLCQGTELATLHGVQNDERSREMWSEQKEQERSSRERSKI